MTALIPTPKIDGSAEQEHVDEAELAAAAFLTRYQGRTLETRPQIELYVRAMEGRGLAATTMDRWLSTVCGFYRFATLKAGFPPTGAVELYVRAMEARISASSEATARCGSEARATSRP